MFDREGTYTLCPCTKLDCSQIFKFYDANLKELIVCINLNRMGFTLVVIEFLDMMCYSILGRYLCFFLFANFFIGILFSLYFTMNILFFGSY